MPFLRPVGSTSSSQLPLEIQSAKTLIGSSQVKCDVVLPGDRSVLDLHALLNLSDDYATATLVPFSATSDGACFLNGRLVPPEGAAVVHGDRIAFGTAENAFVFSLTNTQCGGSKPVDRSFRSTVDALRGDRAPPVAASSARPPTTKKQDSNTTSQSARASRERLDKFLLDASTDSLLSDFVERKLRNSNSASVSKRQRQKERPTAMEPPPSLSASSVSSFRSSLNDSILDRTARHPEASNTNVELLLSQNQSLLSTAERNYAEIEKLRLSQRMREINNVLNGHLNFGSSYLSMERRSSGSASMRFSSPVKAVGKSFARSDRGEGEGAEEEEEGTEEMPTLVEKLLRKPIAGLQSVPPLHQPTLCPSMKSSVVSLLGKSLQSNQMETQEDSLGNDEEISVPVDESLPSFSEAILRQPIRRDTVTKKITNSASPSVAISQSVVKTDQPILPATTRKPRPQLHQQLIDRTVRRKRHEALTDAFHGWRRGLRVQQQRRRDTNKQFQHVSKKLQLLRRNHRFWRWKRWTEHKQQVLECRQDAFTQRQHNRLMQRMWIQWEVHTLRVKQRRWLLRRFVVSISTTRLRSGFNKWRVLAERLRLATQEQNLTVSYQDDMEKRMEAIARFHHQTRAIALHLQRVVRAWHRAASRETKKKRVLCRLLQTGIRRHQRRAWNAWKKTTLLIRQVEQIDQQRRAEVAKTTETAAEQLKVREQELHDQHAKQLGELQSKLEEQQQLVRGAENEKQEAKKRQVDAKAAAKMHWNTRSEVLLKNVIAEADTQISDVSARLEAFLQHMDLEPEAARFQAASFLVESMLKQKLCHVNARVEAQEAMLQTMKNGDHDCSSPTTKPVWKTALANNGRFLLEMVQQRYARLHQLYQAIAKLAATVVDQNANTRSSRHGSHVRVDAAKFNHAAFLTDAMHDRTLQQLEAVLSIHHRHCTLASLSSSVQQARKY